MKLSIITINYNNKDGLQKTIDSVIGQTWRDFEWIAIDGGSTDGSKELIEKYQEHFSYWCSERDKGIYNAMNKGISHAKGDYISCMNSGDTFYDKDTLRKVFSTERVADVLYGDFMETNDSRTETIHFPSPVEIHNLYRWCFCHQAMFVRTSIMQKKGFDESYKIYADRHRWTEAALSGNTFEYLNLTICHYDTSGISSSNPEIKELELNRIRKELFPATIVLSINRLIEYEENETIQIVRLLLMRGKLTVNFTKAVIRLLDSIIRRSSALLHNSSH